MNISLYNIKKWTKMIFGKSIFHVNQKVGRYYSKFEIRGYYNDLTEKVIKDIPSSNKYLPKIQTEKWGMVDFPIAIFQYGLGAYDLFIESNSSFYFSIAQNAAEWAVLNQSSSGAWDTFGYQYPDSPYSSMAQAEGASLLLRIYKETNKKIYLQSAIKAIDFMIKETVNGGTKKTCDDDVFFLECTNFPVILNGWIFSLFGLYDIFLVTKIEEYQNIFNKSFETLSKYISKFDIKFWSKYDMGSSIASPFYHKLHISLLTALVDLRYDSQIYHFIQIFTKYDRSLFKKSKAFVIKAFQKLFKEHI